MVWGQDLVLWSVFVRSTERPIIGRSDPPPVCVRCSDTCVCLRVPVRNARDTDGERFGYPCGEEASWIVKVLFSVEIIRVILYSRGREPA